MYRIKEIKKLLGNKDYLPVVKKSGDGCVVTMPEPKLTKPALGRLIEVYAVNRSREKQGVYCNSSYQPEETFVAVPEYAIRAFILCGIAYTCNQLPISSELLAFFNEKGDEVDGISDVIESPSGDERTKEGFLIKLFSDAKEENFDPVFEEVALTHGVREGYRLCKSFHVGSLL